MSGKGFAMRVYTSLFSIVIFFVACKKHATEPEEPKPYSTVVWQKTSLDSLWISSFGFSGTKIFAGGGGAVFLSTDDGGSWTSVSNGLPYDAVSALAVMGANVFAGAYRAGVSLSTDDGAHWTAVNTGLTNTMITSLAVSGTNLFASTYGGGVFLSTNDGTSWSTINNGLTNTYVTSIAVAGTNLFAGSVGVFRSTTNGSSWTNILGDSIWATFLAVFEKDLAVGTNCGTAFDCGSIWLSTDLGFSWRRVFERYPTGPASTGGENLTAIGGSGEYLLAATNVNGVYFSNNNGKSWTLANSGLTATSVKAFAVIGNTVFAGTSSGVFRGTMQ